MQEEPKKTDLVTKHLPNIGSPKYLPAQPDTVLPDAVLPWVLEMRVVGTAETIHTSLKETMLIGRADPERGLRPEIDLTPFNAHQQGVSRRHAMLLGRNGRITVKDLNSTNGTRLNGFGLIPQIEYRICHGDELMMGQFRLQIHFSIVPAPKDIAIPQQAGGIDPAQAVRVKGKRVLVIAGVPALGAVFRSTLAGAGFAVTVVRTTGAAIQEISERLPDAIVFDLQMPDLAALDFVRYVRKNAARRVPVLIVSGATAGFHMSKALEAGADQYLGKPLNTGDLISAVGKAVMQAAG
ncbi:MAG: response regulator [Chloroflexota bacterium]